MTPSDTLSIAFTAFSAVFSVMDPFGLVPLYLAMTASDPPDARRRTAWKACIAAMVALIIFALVGPAILRYFSISEGSFRIAGGILLFLTALDMLRARPSLQRASPEEEVDGVEKPDISIVPLAFPMLAGPGSIATVMLLMGRATIVWAKVCVLVSIVITAFATFGILVGGTWAEQHLGKTGLNVLKRVIGLLLAAIAVQFIVDGIHDVMPLTRVPA